MLKNSFSNNNEILEAGCDEAGRGCLAGPVFAASVVLPFDFNDERIKDSKKLNKKSRIELRKVIEDNALAYAVYSYDHQQIDDLNILKASVLCMHEAISRLSLVPDLLLIDGNKFIPYRSIPHQCIIKGDDLYLSIAAASILAKTYRDEYMENLHSLYPQFGWDKNKGYPTKYHRQALLIHGLSPHHRKSFCGKIIASKTLPLLF